MLQEDREPQQMAQILFFPLLHLLVVVGVEMKAPLVLVKQQQAALAAAQPMVIAALLVLLIKDTQVETEQVALHQVILVAAVVEHLR